MPDKSATPPNANERPAEPNPPEGIARSLHAVRDHLRKGEGVAALQMLLRLPAREQNRGQVLRELATTYIVLGNRTLAEMALKAYLKKSSRDADMWVILARTQRELHRPYVARDSLLRAIQLKPDDERYLAELAALYRDLEHSDAALSVARRILEVNPSSARGHFEAGLSYLQWGRYGDALNHLKAATAQDPLLTGLPEAQRRAEKLFEECSRELQAAEERLKLAPENLDEAEHVTSLLVCVGEIVRALDKADVILRSGPGRSSTLELRGRILIEMDRFEEAMASLRRCEEIDPERSYLGFHMRRIARLVGEPDDRLAFYEKQILLNPEQHWWTLNQGMLLLELGNARDALKVLRMGIRRCPDRHLLHETLARAQELSGRPRASLRALRKATELSPRDPECWNALGNQYSRLGRPGEARLAFRQALLLHPEFEWPHHNLALLALQERNLEQCVRESRLALDANPEYVEARHTLSVALFRLGKYREAEEECLRTLESAPDDWRAHLNLANACDSLGEHARAREAYEKAISLNDNDPAVYLDFGIYWASQGKLDRAIRYFEAARRLAPRSGDVFNNLGLACIRRRNLRTGIAHLRKAVALSPENAAAHYNLGLALYRARKYSEALEHTRRSIALEPAYAAAHNDLGCTLEKLGLFREAADAYRKTLELNANEPHALNNLAALYFKPPQGGFVTRTEAREFLFRALPHLKEPRQVRQTFKQLERLERATAVAVKKAVVVKNPVPVREEKAPRQAPRGFGKRRK